MLKRLLAFVAVLLVLAAPAAAHAEGTWAWPVEGRPALTYGARYTDADGGSCTHGGIDIEAATGATVRACSPGEVVFCGLVPAGAGARAWAVTVQTADGLRVTYLPLNSAGVSRGQAVDAGQALGSLAGSGDASSGETHLHLGVKRGGRALDPAAFLGPRGAASSQPAPASVAPRAQGKTVPRSSALAPAASPSAAEAPAAAPHVAVNAPAASPATAIHDALSVLARTPSIARAEPVSAPAVVSLSKVRADLTAARAGLLSWATRIGLILLSCAAVWPVLRKARAVGAVAGAEPEMRRAR